MPEEWVSGVLDVFIQTQANKSISLMGHLLKLNQDNVEISNQSKTVIRRRVCYTKIVFKKVENDKSITIIFKGSEDSFWKLTPKSLESLAMLKLKMNETFEANKCRMVLPQSSSKPRQVPSLYSENSANRIDESASIEFHVKITEMTGIKKQKLMNFDDDVAKQSSDVVLKVGDEEFYVNKMYLSLHSTYFKTLFSRNFGESGKSIIELKDIDTQDFQDFLEVLYAVSIVKNETVSEILKLADFFGARVVVRRCEEFLMNLSDETLKYKFQLAVKYKMSELKKKCFSEMNKTTNFESFIPEDATDFDSETWKELFAKAVSFK